MRTVIFRAPRGAILGAMASLAAAACNGGGGPAGTCESDDASYSCAPVDADAGGCAANAPDGAPAFYALGCQGTFPGCGANGGALTCTCVANVGYAFDAQAVLVCGGN